MATNNTKDALISILYAMPRNSTFPIVIGGMSVLRLGLTDGIEWFELGGCEAHPVSDAVDVLAAAVDGNGQG